MTIEQYEKYMQLFDRPTCRGRSVPKHIRHGIVRYILDGASIGGFLQAVIANNLYEAVARADDLNIEALPEIVGYFYDWAPMACWGSPKALKEWKGENHAMPKV